VSWRRNGGRRDLVGCAKMDQSGWAMWDGIEDVRTVFLIVAFWALLLAFTAAYNINMLVFEYRSIDMRCIVLPVKLDGGLSISALRNKQLYHKIEIKSLQFETPPFGPSLQKV
jgi:hypothetical protein